MGVVETSLDYSTKDWRKKKEKKGKKQLKGFQTWKCKDAKVVLWEQDGGHGYLGGGGGGGGGVTDNTISMILSPRSPYLISPVKQTPSWAKYKLNWVHLCIYKKNSKIAT